MASLSDLLNPSPAEEQVQDERKEASPSSQIPPNPYAQTQGQSPDTQSGKLRREDEELAKGLHTDSTSNSNPSEPASFSIPPQNEAPTAQARRMSTLADGAFATPLPRADDFIRRLSASSHDMHSNHARSPETQALRKMSSPSLEQYHISSRSPEQVRRQSLADITPPNPSFTLPPLQFPASIQSSIPPNDRQVSALASKVTVHGLGLIDSQTSFDQQFSGPSQVLKSPSPASQPIKTDSQVTSSLIKSETASSARDSIPAFIPVVSFKQSPAPATDGSVDSTAPIPSTEMPATESRGTKRPAPKSTTKKGIAKKGPPAKKQKTSGTIPAAKSKTKSKANLNKTLSASATPLDSSPAPPSARGISSAGRSSPSPAEIGASDDDEDEDVEMGSADEDADVYCICRRPDKGTFMIGCDGKCDDWYHGKCVNILEKDKNLIDRYICPICVENGVGVTTWKRMCRRPGCRMPARLAKKDEEPSKYCSDECGVVFFRDQVGRTRGASEVTASGKKAARKQDGHADDDLGPRGGVIHARELKSLVTSVSTFEDFKKLGDGVLSPPATPSPKQSKRDPAHIKAEDYLDESQTKRLDEIHGKKEELRTRHALLKDQAKMINLVRQAGTRTAESKGMKPKDVCGYDDLVHFSEVEFAEWRASSLGKKALKSGIIEAAADGEGDTDMASEPSAHSSRRAGGPCMKKKCLKHFEWSKLALETNRSETIENSETMRALEREEQDIRERAGLKARQVKSGDLGGHAELHTASMKTDSNGTPAKIEDADTATEERAVQGTALENVDTPPLHDAMDVTASA